MRILGLITVIAGFVALVADLSLRMLSNSGSWLWVLGVVLLLGGLALILAAVVRARRTKASAPRAASVPGIETARLLDNFEQRFAELKGRKANETVLRDLYSLASELETRGRAPQATAVFRHLARTDNTYRDVATRLRRLVEAERAAPAATVMALPAPARAPVSKLSMAAHSTSRPTSCMGCCQRLGPVIARC